MFFFLPFSLDLSGKFCWNEHKYITMDKHDWEKNSKSNQNLINYIFSLGQFKYDSWLFFNQFDFKSHWTILKSFLHSEMFNIWNYKHLFVIEDIVLWVMFMIYMYSKLFIFSSYFTGFIDKSGLSHWWYHVTKTVQNGGAHLISEILHIANWIFWYSIIIFLWCISVLFSIIIWRQALQCPFTIRNPLPPIHNTCR